MGVREELVVGYQLCNEKAKSAYVYLALPAVACINYMQARSMTEASDHRHKAETGKRRTQDQQRQETQKQHSLPAIAAAHERYYGRNKSSSNASREAS